MTKTDDLSDNMKLAQMMEEIANEERIYYSGGSWEMPKRQPGEKCKYEQAGRSGVGDKLHEDA